MFLDGNVGETEARANAPFEGAPYVVDANKAGASAEWKFIPGSRWVKEQLIGNWKANLRETEALHDEVGPMLKEMLAAATIEFMADRIVRRINDEVVPPSRLFEVRETEAGDVCCLFS